jgi:uncharacterized protein YbaA (DUF1428 family)
MAYVDGYVMPIAKKHLATYRRLATISGKLWREHGALEYRECIGEDLAVKMLTPFPRAVKIERGETLVFAWVVFRSRGQRDRVNAKVMKDPRLAASMKKYKMPFDTKRILYGGFEVLVAA